MDRPRPCHLLPPRRLQPLRLAPGEIVVLDLVFPDGDVDLAGMEAKYRLHNNGAGPAEALVVVASFSEGQGPLGHLYSVPPDPIGGSEARVDTFDISPLVGSMHTDLPGAQIAVGLGRAALAPGRTLVVPGAAGPLLLVVESGPIGIGVDGGMAGVHQRENGYSMIEREGTLRTGDGALVDPKTAIVVRNVGSESAVLLIVTLLPEPTAASAP